MLHLSLWTSHSPTCTIIKPDRTISCNCLDPFAALSGQISLQSACAQKALSETDLLKDGAARCFPWLPCPCLLRKLASSKRLDSKLAECGLPSLSLTWLVVATSAGASTPKGLLPSVHLSVGADRLPWETCLDSSKSRLVRRRRSCRAIHLAKGT